MAQNQLETTVLCWKYIDVTRVAWAFVFESLKVLQVRTEIQYVENRARAEQLESNMVLFEHRKAACNYFTFDSVGNTSCCGII